MISANTLDRLRSFKLPAFIDGLAEQAQSAKYHELTFEERLTLLVDAEHTRRLDVRTRRLLQQARIPTPCVSLDDVDFTVLRGLRKPTFLELAQGTWARSGVNVIITGPTGIGKTFLSSVLAAGLCRQGMTVRYQRTHVWLADFLAAAEHSRFRQTIAIYRRAVNPVPAR